jgi:hypothetical protein
MAKTYDLGKAAALLQTGKKSAKPESPASSNSKFQIQGPHLLGSAEIPREKFGRCIPPLPYLDRDRLR